MLQIGHETLYTKTEILKRMREYLEVTGQEATAIDAHVLAVALNESEDYIMGAIRPQRREEANL